MPTFSSLMAPVGVQRWHNDNTRFSEYTNLTNPTMHLSHTPQHTTLYQKCAHVVCIFLFQCGVLWNMGQVHCGICETSRCKKFPITNCRYLRSVAIPTMTHFSNRHFWHWFLVFLSIIQFAFHLQWYFRSFCIVLRKNPCKEMKSVWGSLWHIVPPLDNLWYSFATRLYFSQLESRCVTYSLIE